MKTSFLAAALISSFSLAGCAVAPSDNDSEGSAPETVVVTAKDTQGLTGSQKLEEDLSPGTVYRFDASEGSIDFGRIDLVTSQSTHLSLTSIVLGMAQSEGVAAESFAQRTFSVSGDLADMGIESDDQDLSAPPEAAPQLAPVCTFFVRYQTADGVWHSLKFPC